MRLVCEDGVIGEFPPDLTRGFGNLRGPDPRSDSPDMSTFSNKYKATGQVSGKPQAAMAALP